MPAHNEKKSRAYSKQHTLNFDKTLPIKSYVLHQKFEAAQFSDKLKPFPHCFLKNMIKHRDTTYALLTQNAKTFNTNQKHWTPCYPKELLLFPQIESNNEQNPVTTHDLDSSNMI